MNLKTGYDSYMFLILYNKSSTFQNPMLVKELIDHVSLELNYSMTICSWSSMSESSLKGEMF